MPKGVPRRFTSFLRPLTGTKNDSDSSSEERPQTWEDGESSFSTTLDRVETTLDRMSRSLFAVDTVAKAVARAKANQLAGSVGLRESDGSGTGALESTPAPGRSVPVLTRSLDTRTSALAQAAEELRMLELRVHEANAFTTDDGEPDDFEQFDDQTSSFAAGDEELAAPSFERPDRPLSSEPPLLVDVVSLGPNVISLDPLTPGLVEQALELPAHGAATSVAPPSTPIGRAVPPATLPSSQPAVPMAPQSRLSEKAGEELEPSASPRNGAIRQAPPSRPLSTSVHDELSLEVPDDVNSDQLCQFLAVLPELMESIEVSSAAYANAPHARDEGVRARNALRQLELAAESVGIRGIASFAAHATSLLDALINTTATVPDGLFATLRDSMACMEHLSDVVWGKTKLADDVPERFELLIEAELRAILDLTLRVEEPSYSASFDPLAGASRSAAPATPTDPSVSPIGRPWRA